MYYSSSRKKCCVEECKDTGSPRHRFPVKDKEVLKIWLERVGKAELECDPKKVFNTCFLCSSHFIKECLLSNRLVAKSLPTLNLPGFSGESSKKNSFLHLLVQQEESTGMNITRVK